MPVSLVVRRGGQRADEGVQANARLTGGVAALLFFVLAAEGVTVLSVQRLLSVHVFIGMLLVPPVLVKMASTGWRFARYYGGSAAYRRKGPPPILLRLLGPVVVVLTVVLLGTGIAVVLAPTSLGGTLPFLHKASFVLWFGAMTIHVLGHALETSRLAPADWLSRTRRDVAGAGIRRWLIVSSVVAGCLLGLLMLAPTSHYRTRHVATSEVSASPGPVKG
jgi:hypothetical protein